MLIFYTKKLINKYRKYSGEEMLKIIMLYLLALFTVIDARGIESEIGIYIGVNSTKNNGGNKFKNPILGLSYQDNKYIVTPRVDVDYTKLNNEPANSLVKVAVNGVYEYENNTYTVPYALAGIGYEYVNGSTATVFESHPFVQGGAGIRVDLEQGFKARVEGKVLQVIGKNDEGNEFMLTAGMSMPFDISNPLGTTKKKLKRPIHRVARLQVPPVKRSAKPLKINNKIVIINSNNNECPIKINVPDLDRDGVSNQIDQCPATPCNFTVDRYGCPVKTTLKINFASNSAEVESSSLSKIYNFADFLLKNRGSIVNIVGHTDSVGSAKHNVRLSYKRANSVMKTLLSKGVSVGRIRAFGRGESEPLTSNSTVSGKAMNRRIEAELIYPKRRR
jgi:OOP family OmpA-OmpF porin